MSEVARIFKRRIDMSHVMRINRAVPCCCARQLICYTQPFVQCLIFFSNYSTRVYRIRHNKIIQHEDKGTRTHVFEDTCSMIFISIFFPLKKLFYAVYFQLVSRCFSRNSYGLAIRFSKRAIQRSPETKKNNNRDLIYYERGYTMYERYLESSEDRLIKTN